jgi:hypothetical protein
MPDASQSRARFLAGFTTCLAFFLILNLLSYFLRSDMFGMLGWQDSIKRVGFPFLFFEEGGFAYRQHFDLAKLLLNASVGVLLSIGGALVWTKLSA